MWNIRPTFTITKFNKLRNITKLQLTLSIQQPIAHLHLKETRFIASRISRDRRLQGWNKWRCFSLECPTIETCSKTEEWIDKLSRTGQLLTKRSKSWSVNRILNRDNSLRYLSPCNKIWFEVWPRPLPFIWFIVPWSMQTRTTPCNNRLLSYWTYPPSTLLFDCLYVNPTHDSPSPRNLLVILLVF